ncbi:MAG: ankyrin repeat domain-containing protein [Gammaproteobacteria bacterium]|nr:ankyrin repeat domain-containing protein [Gammaproteobacteria bacterium]
MANDQDVLSDALNGNYAAIKEKISSKNELKIYDEQGYSLFMLAVESSNIELVEYLISIGADINEALDDGTMPIHIAASANYTDIIKLLVENNAQLNALAGIDSATPMHFAMEAESIDAYNLLIELGANQTIKNKHGYLASDYKLNEE